MIKRHRPFTRAKPTREEQDDRASDEIPKQQDVHKYEEQRMLRVLRFTTAERARRKKELSRVPFVVEVTRVHLFTPFFRHSSLTEEGRRKLTGKAGFSETSSLAWRMLYSRTRCDIVAEMLQRFEVHEIRNRWTRFLSIRGQRARVVQNARSESDAFAFPHLRLWNIFVRYILPDFTQRFRRGTTVLRNKKKMAQHRNILIVHISQRGETKDDGAENNVQVSMLHPESPSRRAKLVIKQRWHAPTRRAAPAGT